MINDILVVLARSNEHTKIEKSIDSDESVDSNETESDAHIKEKYLQLRKQITIWKKNEYLFKSNNLNGHADDLYDC